ncbi:Glutathione S-transferase 1-like [Oopsacas minuta]|uniref:Glutathione S-transferase 1-like n=1 Tax=Oopsacas minuta TaxID=111878 RepID=A0AAV7K6A5_9METZ|nr:Glutathione S-transferase 1-like [Oopsacas minuta]
MASEAKPKLYYFDGPGKAEVTRLILVAAGKEFEDIRFSSFEEWTTKYKADSPLGLAPYYEEGGVKIGGSLCIARLVAEANGLGGSNCIENALLSSYADLISDMISKLYPFKFGPEDKKEEAKKECLKNMPAKFAQLEKSIKDDGTFLGKPSWPDFLLSQLCQETIQYQLGDTFKDCPKIGKVTARVDSNPKIQEFRAKHKK